MNVPENTVDAPASADMASADMVAAELIEELAARIRAGEHVDIDAYIAQHAEHADRLRALLPTLQVLADLSNSGSATVSPGIQGESNGVLGDFRIIDEIGRGGMGIVYEAEQISLSRRVALKVLPFAATLDDRQIQRFKNEAKAAGIPTSSPSTSSAASAAFISTRCSLSRGKRWRR
jgi:ADP-ribosylglycohydrolase